MESICIVTDSSVQFPQPAFVGRNLVKIIALKINKNGVLLPEDHALKAVDFPLTADDSLHLQLEAPSVAEFQAIFFNLSLMYHQILGIFISSGLSECFNNALKAASSLRGGINIQIIDSMTTSVGLGMLVQSAAEQSAQDGSLIDAERQTRVLIPHTYTLLCIPGITYLYYNKFIERAQAIVCEMLGLFPIFSLEDGRLTPVEKVRNHRHVIEFYQEFLDEFDSLNHIAFLQGNPSNMQEAHQIREFVQEKFSHTPFTSHPINVTLAALLGPRANALFVMETTNGNRIQLEW